MPTYRRIYKKSTCTHILNSYEYIQQNSLQTPTRSNNTLLQTRTIPYTEKFLCQPICQGIRFRSEFNTHQTICYEQSRSQNIPLHASRLHTTLYTSKKTTILDTKTFFAPPHRPRMKIQSKKNCYIIQCHTHARFTHHHPLLQIPSIWMILLLVKT